MYIPSFHTFRHDGYRMKLQQLQELATTLGLPPHGTQQQLHTRINTFLKTKEHGSLDWKEVPNDNQEPIAFSKLPPEILLNIVKHMRFTEIKKHCTNSPAFQNLCAQHRNTIAQSIFDSLGYKFDINIKGQQHHLLKQLHAYNDTLDPTNWDTFLHFADLELVSTFRWNIDHILGEWLLENLKAIQHQEDNEEKHEFVVRLFHIATIFISVLLESKKTKKLVKVITTIKHKVEDGLTKEHFKPFHSQLQSILDRLNHQLAQVKN